VVENHRSDPINLIAGHRHPAFPLEKCGVYQPGKFAYVSCWQCAAGLLPQSREERRLSLYPIRLLLLNLIPFARAPFWSHAACSFVIIGARTRIKEQACNPPAKRSHFIEMCYILPPSLFLIVSWAKSLWLELPARNEHVRVCARMKCCKTNFNAVENKKRNPAAFACSLSPFSEALSTCTC